jgi:hypothetical protein
MYTRNICSDRLQWLVPSCKEGGLCSPYSFKVNIVALLLQILSYALLAIVTCQPRHFVYAFSG